MCNKDIITNKPNKYPVQGYLEPSTQTLPEDRISSITPIGRVGYVSRAITSSLLNKRDFRKFYPDDEKEIKIIEKFFMDRKGKLVCMTDRQFDLIYALSHYFSVCFINDEDVIRRLNYLEYGGDIVASIPKQISLRMLSRILNNGSERTRYLEEIYDDLMFLSSTKYVFTYMQYDDKRNERVKRLSVSQFINIHIDGEIADTVIMDPDAIKKMAIDNDIIDVNFSKYFIFGVGKHSAYKRYALIKPNYFKVIRNSTNARNPVLRPLIDKLFDEWPQSCTRVKIAENAIYNKYRKKRLTEDNIKEVEQAKFNASLFRIDIDELLNNNLYKSYKGSYENTRVIRARYKEYLNKAIETLIHDIGIITDKSRIDFKGGKIICYFSLDYNSNDELELLESVEQDSTKQDSKEQP